MNIQILCSAENCVFGYDVGVSVTSETFADGKFTLLSVGFDKLVNIVLDEDDIYCFYILVAGKTLRFLVSDVLLISFVEACYD